MTRDKKQSKRLLTVFLTFVISLGFIIVPITTVSATSKTTVHRGIPRSTKILKYYVKRDGRIVPKESHYLPYRYFVKKGIFYKQVVYQPQVRPYSYYKYSLQNTFFDMSGIQFTNKKNPHVYIDVNSFKEYKKDVRAAMNTWNKVLQYKVFINSKKEYHAKFIKDKSIYAQAWLYPQGTYGVKHGRKTINITRSNMRAEAKDQYKFAYLTLLHELGHTISLGHTYQDKTNYSIFGTKYVFDSTRDIMDVDATNAYYISDMDIATALRSLHLIKKNKQVQDYIK